MTYTTTPTTDLKVGQLINAHGAVIRLASINRQWTDERTGRPVVNFATEWVSGSTGMDDVDRWMMAGNYRIQGNDLARETVITD